MGVKAIVFYWIRGKDSLLALHHLKQDTSCEIARLLTSVSAVYERISRHEERGKVLLEQARSIDLFVNNQIMSNLPKEVDPCDKNAVFHTLVGVGSRFQKGRALSQYHKMNYENY